MSDEITSHELMLWSLLIGAMLTNDTLRKEVGSKLAIDDVPKPYTDVWRALVDGDKEGVRQCAVGWKLEVGKDGTIPAVVRKLQELAFQRFIGNARMRVEFGASGLTPAEFKEKLVRLVNRIEQREAALKVATVAK